jgi:hypothetical protein
MIEVSISAVKGGFRELYRTTNLPQSVAREIRHDSGSGFSIGQEAFSILYVTSGVVFSKCRIVTDGMGGRRVGNVNISVFIPITHSLSGANVVELLNKLLDTYCRNYAPDNNLENIFEDWTFVSVLINQYESRLMELPEDDIESCQQSSGEAAFIYYYEHDDEQQKHFSLQKYFDAPYQNEYSSYKQVFFVEQRFENKLESPLSALRHNPNANLTGKIDLDNPPYKLKDFNGQGKGGIKIEIWANDHIRSNQSVIKRKDTVRIKYSKNEFYFPIEETGKITDSKISQYLSIVGENKITVKNDVILTPVVRQILLEVKDRQGNPVSDAKITCQNEFSKATKPATLNEIRFEGEEIKASWTVSAQKGDLIAQDTFTPNNKSASIQLILQKYKKITFKVVDDDNKGLDGYIVEIKDESVKRNNCKDFKVCGDCIEFYGDAIDKSWNIEIGHDKYHTESFKYCPAKDENSKKVTLHKRPTQSSSNNNKKKYYLVIDEKKGKKADIERYAVSRDYFDEPKFTCGARFGYKFVIWKLHIEKIEQYDGYFEAIFKELWYHKILRKKIWILWIITILIITTVILLIPSGGSDNQPKPLDDSESQAALIMHATNPDSLKVYMDSWDNQKPEIKKESNVYLSLVGGFWSIFGYCIREANDSTEDKKWQKVHQQFEQAIQEAIFGHLGGNELKLDVLNRYKTITADTLVKSRIDQCITFRTNLEQGNVSAINKLQFPYSKNQEALKEAIEAIGKITDKNKQSSVSEAMKNDTTIREKNLNEIADFINKKIAEKSGQSGGGGSSRSTGGSSSNGTGSDNSSAGTTGAGVEPNNDLQNKFWELVYKVDVKKEDFDNLFKNKDPNNPYTIFYNTYISINKNDRLKPKQKNAGWVGFDDGFGKIEVRDRQNARTLEKLKELIKQQIKNESN